MKKLSELSNDTKLYISNSRGEDEVMTKEDFLKSIWFLNYPESEGLRYVAIANKEISKFNLWDVIERIGEDDTYESWDEDVYNELKDLPETKAFLEKVEKVFNDHPTYWDGEYVEIDMLPSDKS